MLILLIPLYTCVHFSLLQKHVYQEMLRSKAGRSFAIFFPGPELAQEMPSPRFGIGRSHPTVREYTYKMPAVVYMKNDQTLPLIEKPRKVVEDDMMYLSHQDDQVEMYTGFEVGNSGNRSNDDSGYDQTDASESSGVENDRGSTRSAGSRKRKANGVKAVNASVSRNESLDSFLPNIPNSPIESRNKEFLSDELRLNLSDTSIISQRSKQDDLQLIPQNRVASVYNKKNTDVKEVVGSSASPRRVEDFIKLERQKENGEKLPVVRAHPLKVSFEDDSGLESFRNETEIERQKAVRPKSEGRKRASDEAAEDLIAS